MKTIPELNSGEVYIVTRWKNDGTRQHLGDYRTFAEALTRARELGAIGTGSHLKTANADEAIVIDCELMDPIFREEKP